MTDDYLDIAGALLVAALIFFGVPWLLNRPMGQPEPLDELNSEDLEDEP